MAYVYARIVGGRYVKITNNNILTMYQSFSLVTRRPTILLPGARSSMVHLATSTTPRICLQGKPTEVQNANQLG
jgi:hypothetical protein